MKLTILKGICNDLAGHLDFQIWFGHFKDIPSKIDTDVLKQKDSLSKMCVAFFKERLPASFDFKRIKSLNLKIDKSQKNLKIAIKIKVDAKEFTTYKISMMN